MKSLILPLALTTALLSTSALAITVYGLGAKSCGEWTTKRENKNTLYIAMTQWVLGYLTGIWDASDTVYDVDGPEIIRWVDNYCEKNPLDLIHKATVLLLFEIEKREGQ